MNFKAKGGMKIEIIIGDKVIHKDSASLNDEKDLKRVLDYLDIKGYYSLKKLIELKKEDDAKRWI